jgi:hypothetical protein
MKTNGAVYATADWAVSGAVYRAVDAAVHWTVDVTVRGAVHGATRHPSLHDFLTDQGHRDGGTSTHRQLSR